MTQKTMHTYYNLDGNFIGDFEKKPLNITFKTTGGIHIHEAILASVDITQQYKQPLQFIYKDVKVNIPYTGKKPNLSAIMQEYTKNLLQNYR